MTPRRRSLPALAVLLTAGALSLVPRRGAHADEPPLPAGTEHSVGVPPFVPSPETRADPTALAEWTRRTLEAGRAVKGTRRAAELLYSAASVQSEDPRDPLLAGRTYEEAFKAAPADDPLGALAALAAFRSMLAARRLENAEPLAAWLEAYERRYIPADGDDVTARRFTLFQREMAGPFQTDVAAVLAALGRHAAAAGRLERAAAANPPGIGPPATLWERAALERFLAGQPERAREDVQKALAADPDPAQRARLLFWELHMRHGLLTPDGELRPTGAQPGKDYLDDLEAVLRELHGNPHVGDHLLSAASSALLARADELALAIYQKALADPVLSRRMYREESLWAAFLPAVNSAIRVGKFDEAEAVLQEVERLAAEPVPLAAPLRVRIKLAREGARAAAERARAPPPPDPEPEAPRLPPELLPPVPPETAPPRVAPAGADGSGASDSVGWPVFAAFGALLALAALLLLRRRR